MQPHETELFQFDNSSSFSPADHSFSKKNPPKPSNHPSIKGWFHRGLTHTPSLSPALRHTHTHSSTVPSSQLDLIGSTITDISCPSSGQRHVDRGLCPEIKQYVVTGKKNRQHTHTTACGSTHTLTHGRPVVTPRQKRQTIATESLCFHVAGLRNLGSIWAQPCRRKSLAGISSRHFLKPEPNLQLLSLKHPHPPTHLRLLLLAMCRHQSVLGARRRAEKDL